MKLNKKALFLLTSFISLLLFINVVVNSDYSLTIVSYINENKEVNKNLPLKLEEDQIFSYSFVANEDNLGIVLIEFDPSNKPISDEILFKIKESGSENWYFTQVYDARQFYYLNEYPFGFPLINDSKGKTYEFELNSTLENTSDHITLGSNKPVVISKYKAKKELLLGSFSYLFNFIFNKFLFSITIFELQVKILLSISPIIIFFIYQFWIKVKNDIRIKKIRKNILHFFKKFIKKYPSSKNIINSFYSLKRNNIFNFWLALVLISVLIMDNYYEFFNILLFSFWIYIALKNRFKNFEVLIVLTTFIVITAIMGILNLIDLQIKANIWVYYLLIYLIGYEFFKVFSKKTSK